MTSHVAVISSCPKLPKGYILGWSNVLLPFTVSKTVLLTVKLTFYNMTWSFQIWPRGIRIFSNMWKSAMQDESAVLVRFHFHLCRRWCLKNAFQIWVSDGEARIWYCVKCFDNRCLCISRRSRLISFNSLAANKIPEAVFSLSRGGEIIKAEKRKQHHVCCCCCDEFAESSWQWKNRIPGKSAYSLCNIICAFSSEELTTFILVFSC